MRCSCHVCDTYMNHSESMELGCVCPECGYIELYAENPKELKID